MSRCVDCGRIVPRPTCGFCGGKVYVDPLEPHYGKNIRFNNPPRRWRKRGQKPFFFDDDPDAAFGRAVRVAVVSVVDAIDLADRVLAVGLRRLRDGIGWWIYRHRHRIVLAAGVGATLVAIYLVLAVVVSGVRSLATSAVRGFTDGRDGDAERVIEAEPEEARPGDDDLLVPIGPEEADESPDSYEEDRWTYPPREGDPEEVDPGLPHTP